MKKKRGKALTPNKQAQTPDYFKLIDLSTALSMYNTDLKHAQGMINPDNHLERLMQDFMGTHYPIAKKLLAQQKDLSDAQFETKLKEVGWTPYIFKPICDAVVKIDEMKVILAEKGKQQLQTGSNKENLAAKSPDKTPPPVDRSKKPKL